MVKFVASRQQHGKRGFCANGRGGGTIVVSLCYITITITHQTRFPCSSSCPCIHGPRIRCIHNVLVKLPIIGQGFHGQGESLNAFQGCHGTPFMPCCCWIEHLCHQTMERVHDARRSGRIMLIHGCCFQWWVVQRRSTPRSFIRGRRSEQRAFVLF